MAEGQRIFGGEEDYYDYFGDSDDNTNIFDRLATSRRRKKAKSHRKIRSRRNTRHTKRKTSRRAKGIHYTKRGQPYIILASGKARFLKKKR